MKRNVVNDIYWLSDRRLLYQSLGNINAIDIDGTNSSTIVSRVNDQFKFTYKGFKNGLEINSIIDLLPDNKNEILIESIDYNGFSTLKELIFLQVRK